MKFNQLIPAQPKMTQQEQQGDSDYDAISELELQYTQRFTHLFSSSGIEFPPPDEYPVLVDFDKANRVVEVTVRIEFELTVQMLIVLSEKGAINPESIISRSTTGVQISTRFPAEQTEFKRFLMSDIGSAGTVSSS